jgi:hypothetical protein
MATTIQEWLEEEMQDKAQKNQKKLTKQLADLVGKPDLDDMVVE